jgi:DNA invertase Pin-like site-specific DNA recombinase
VAPARGQRKTKAEGVYDGRPPSIEAIRLRELKAQGMGSADIAKALKIGRASVLACRDRLPANEG